MHMTSNQMHVERPCCASLCGMLCTHLCPACVFVGQPFSYICVIDFEATCWSEKKLHRTQEISESSHNTVNNYN